MRTLDTFNSSTSGKEMDTVLSRGRVEANDVDMSEPGWTLSSSVVKDCTVSPSFKGQDQSRGSERLRRAENLHGTQTPKVSCRGCQK